MFGERSPNHSPRALLFHSDQALLKVRWSNLRGTTVASYKGLIVDRFNSPPSSEDIRRVEMELGCSLPADYRAMIDACNGASLNYFTTVELAFGRRETMGYCSFHAVSPGEWGTLPFELAQIRRWPGFPAQKVLPIARDGGGSVLFLDLREGCRVLAFVDGLPAWTGREGNESLVPVAKSLDEYLAGMVIPDEIAKDHLETFDVTPESVRATAEWLDSRCVDWRRKCGDIWASRCRS
ncbi:MAG TPA: SMI1/KNR4 family protein [Planctomycetota bacterium]|nr:SMI1/KNR4 family protein [Planctomycetota bacterium]